MITVFGSINLDLIARVDHLPAPGETVPGRDYVTAPGGKGANQALAVQRAGTPVRLAGACGSDSHAEEALALLSADGADLTHVARFDGPTGVAMILVDEAGENMIAVVPGANGRIDPGTHAGLDFTAGDVLLMQLEAPIDAARALARRARDAGATVVLNLAPFLPEAAALVDVIDIAVVNEGEALGLAVALGVAAGDPDTVTASLAAETGLSVVTTKGAAGVIAHTPAGSLSAAALPIAAVDTVGAGDTFCGYLAAALHDDGGITAQGLTLAAAAGSLACLTRGAQPAIPTRDAVEAALAA